MSLQNLRNKIDEIDYKIHDLLNERAELALQIGKVKKQNPDPVKIFQPEREKEILEAISAYNTGPLTDESLVTIFKSIISACRALQTHE